MTAIGLASLPRGKVPVWQMVKTAYRDTFGKPRALLTAAAFPFVLSFLIDVSLPEQQGISTAFLRILLNTLAVSIFELLWLRYLLLGREALPRLLPPLDRRVRRFVGYALLLTLFTLPTLFLQTVLTEASLEAPHLLGAMMIVLYFIGSYLCVRFGFVFAWIALDARERLGASWHATRGNGLRILIATVIVGLPLLLPLFVFGAVLGIVAPDLAIAWEEGRIEGAWWWVLLAGGQVLLYLYYALSSAVLMHAFCLLTGRASNLSELLERFE